MDLESSIAVAIVVVVAAIAGLSDVRTFKVPNRLTLPLAVTGVAYHTIAGGLAGLQLSLLGALFGFGVLFGLYVLGAIGAGDVKLMAGVGAWLGVSTSIYVFAVAAAGTALYSIIVLLRRGNLSQAFTTIQITLMQLQTIGKHLGADERVESIVHRKDRRKRLVPFAAMVALGAIVVAVWKQVP
ncbi:MAG TPA: A24 family peptidase [Thermoguttaceae bacterium]|nr:A24 family peptidase [Thermoguttaceae bacterium]